MGGAPSAEEVIDFIHNNLYFKGVVIPFGRKEVEETLQKRWNIEEPESAKRSLR
jgi:hypothetical protein